MSALKLCPTCGSEYPANERFCPRDGSALRAQGGGNDLVGSIIAERYHVIKKLGEGGMGQVYLAEHVKMGRKSAVKVMNPGMVNDADAISRFNREASNASRINHQHVAGIYDFGETADGLIYLAMEYVEGEPLTDLVSSSGAIAPARAAEITRQIGEALTVAHEMGIVHRDLKPDNIMITRSRDGSDCVKVVDFGIAKAANIESQKVTRTGLAIGTPEYMSPEQLAGDPLDGRSDIYSMGLVAFHMLTGVLPFPSETVQESMIMRLTDQPKRLDDMRPEVSWPPTVQAVMDRALQRDAGARYQTAGEFGRALAEAVKVMPASAEIGRAGANTAGSSAATAAVPATRVSTAAPPGGVGAGEGVVEKKGRSLAMMLGVGGTVAAIAAVAAVLLSGDGTKANKAAADPAPTEVGATTSAGGNPSAGGTGNPPISETPAQARPKREVATYSASVPVTTPSQQTAPEAVTTLAKPKSYAAELEALSSDIKDPESAVRVDKKLAVLRKEVRLSRDIAILQLVEAEVALNTQTEAEACKLWRRVNQADLGETLKNSNIVFKKQCEGT